MMVTEFIYTAMGRLSAVNKSKARIHTDTLNYEMDASRILSIVNRQYVLRFCSVFYSSCLVCCTSSHHHKLGKKSRALQGRRETRQTEKASAEILDDYDGARAGTIFCR